MQESTVINMMWAWLFSQKATERVVTINNQPTKVGMSRQEIEQMTRLFLSPIVGRVVVAYDWDFIFGDDSFASVVGTSEYVLRGADDDCGEVFQVRYGTGRGGVLEQYNYLQMDRRAGSDPSTGASPEAAHVYGYTLHGESDDGFPIMKLWDTPTATNTIQYRYRKKDLSLGIFPDSFAWTIRDFVKAEFDPKFLGVAESSLKKLIARYEPGGDEYETVRKDPDIDAGNVRRNNITGGC